MRLKSLCCSIHNIPAFLSQKPTINVRFESQVAVGSQPILTPPIFTLGSPPSSASHNFYGVNRFQRRSSARCEVGRRMRPSSGNWASFMSSASITILVGEAGRQAKVLVRQGIELAKAELVEKAVYCRNAATKAGVGAGFAFSAFLLLLAALGLLLSYSLKSIGLGSVGAGSAACCGVGLFVMLVGGLLLLKGLRALSRTSISPQRTLSAIQRLKNHRPKREDAPSGRSIPRRSSRQIEDQVLVTEQRLGRTMQALGARLSPSRFRRALCARVQAKPRHWNLAALAIGFAGSIWLVKKLRK